MQVVFDWWLRQLGELWPGGLSKTAARGPDAAILAATEDRVTLLIRRRGVTEIASQARAGEAGFRDIAHTIASQRGWPTLLVLRIPALGVLSKRLALPLAAQGGLEALLGFEMDRETPFARDEVYWGYRVRHRDVPHGRLDVELVIIPRPAVASALDAARQAGLEPAFIEVDTAPGETMLVRLGAGMPREQVRSRQSLMALAAAACLLAVIAIATPFLRQHQALAAADATIAALTGQAEEAAALRKSLDQLSDAASVMNKERDRTGGALSLLAAVSRVLPDNTHLTALSQHGDKITISGMSPSAADLIGLLAKGPLFRDPAFASPVVHIDGQSLEMFTISVALTPPGAS